MKTPTFIVYMLTNTVNGKRYIGITTKGLRRRVSAHFGDATRGSNIRLHQAIRKHGTSSFTVEIVYEAVDEREMKMVERGLIAQYGTMARGYNSTIGGDGVEGAKWTDDMRSEHSVRMKKRKLPKNHGENVSKGLKARFDSDPEFRASRSLGMKGKTRSAEDREKRADAGRKYWASADTEERKKKSAAGVAKWRAENPKLAAEYQRKASVAGTAATLAKKKDGTPWLQ